MFVSKIEKTLQKFEICEFNLSFSGEGDFRNRKLRAFFRKKKRFFFLDEQPNFLTAIEITKNCN